RRSRGNVLRCKEMAMSAHVGGVHDARRHAGNQRTEVILWLSTVGRIVTLVLGLLLAPLAADAQPPPTVPRIGILSSFSLTADSRNRDAFRHGLHELGYVEGQTIVVEERWA